MTENNENKPESTRNRTQFPMYLSESLQEDLNETFEQKNAMRILDDREQMEKHKDFLEAVVRTGLEGDWQSRIEK